MITGNRKSVLTAAAVLLGAALIGRYLLPPVRTTLPGPIWMLLSGLGAISLIAHLHSMVVAILLSLKLIRAMTRLFPKSTEELREMGVETPLDFVFVMWNTTLYRPISPFGKELPVRRLRTRLIRRTSMSLFMDMFGRLPIGFESDNWDYISTCEVADALGKSEDEVTEEDLSEHVSEKVKDYFKTILPGKLSEISSDLTAR